LYWRFPSAPPSSTSPNTPSFQTLFSHLPSTGISKSQDRLSVRKAEVSMGSTAETSNTVGESQSSEGNLTSLPDEGIRGDIESLLKGVAASSRPRTKNWVRWDIEDLRAQRDFFCYIGQQCEDRKKGKGAGSSGKGKQREDGERAKRTLESEHKDPATREAKRPRLSKVGVSSSGGDSNREESSDSAVEFPWSRREDQSSPDYDFESRAPELAKKTNSVLRKYLRDEKTALRRLQTQINLPPFPQSLWEPVLLNRFVDLNDIPGRKVVDYGCWISAFDEYAEAVEYTYPHRKQELGEYRRWFMQLFQFHNTLNHNAIIRFDRLFRRELAINPRLTLYDVQSPLYSVLFRCIQQSISEEDANICRR